MLVWIVEVFIMYNHQPIVLYIIFIKFEPVCGYSGYTWYNTYTTFERLG